jgi:Ni,Fe-hydrogenase III component G
MNVSPLGLAASALPCAMPAQRCRVNSGQLLSACRLAWERGGQLVALWASDERDRDRGFAIRVLLRDGDGLTLLEHTLPDESAHYPDLSTIFPVANRMQRAAFDLVGAQCDADDQRPWTWQAAWPIDRFPLQRDFEVSPAWAQGEEDYPFVRVAGDGVHEIAVGPVHAGTIEPGHFRFQVVGEKVLRLEERLGYTHKGIEKRFESLPLLDGYRLAGRISGDSTVAYACAYAQAVESIAQCAAPRGVVAGVVSGARAHREPPGRSGLSRQRRRIRFRSFAVLASARGRAAPQRSRLRPSPADGRRHARRRGVRAPGRRRRVDARPMPRAGTRACRAA